MQQAIDMVKDIDVVDGTTVDGRTDRVNTDELGYSPILPYHILT
jgi:hypothetical protein